jgi:hypothetical protein
VSNGIPQKNVKKGENVTERHPKMPGIQRILLRVFAKGFFPP